MAAASGTKYVVVFAGEPIPEVVDLFRTARLRWVIMPEWASGPGRVHAWGFVIPALRLIRKERPDVVAVHFGNEMPTLAASLLCQLMGWGARLFSLLTTQQLNNSTTSRPPRWVWEQDQQIKDPGRISSKLSKIRLLGLGVDRYLAVYEGGRESMLKRGIPAKKISVIYNSVAPYTPTRPKGWLRQELAEVDYRPLTIDHGPQAADPCEAPPAFRSNVYGLRSIVSPVLLVTNGSLIPRKRIDFILKACGELEKKSQSQILEGGLERTEERGSSSASMVYGLKSKVSVHPWRLLVIGEGPERERLRALATELGISDRVNFLGMRNDVREILPECDIYLHASLAETCTYAVTEAMAASLPVLMTVAGAAREQIEEGVTGYVLERYDAEGFKVRLRDLVLTRPLRASMGKAAVIRWQERYRVDIAARKYHALYTEVARGDQGR
jgi:glycosyltransferase involved in cell wall biosynthesis